MGSGCASHRVTRGGFTFIAQQFTQLSVTHFQQTIGSQRITAQIAHKRQVGFLAKKLRREDDTFLDALRHVLDHDKADSRRESAALHRIEALRDRLVDEGDAALSEIMAEHPHADRQHLRQLARNAKEEKLRNKPPHAYRELFRALRELMASDE